MDYVDTYYYATSRHKRRIRTCRAKQAEKLYSTQGKNMGITTQDCL